MVWVILKSPRGALGVVLADPWKNLFDCKETGGGRRLLSAHWSEVAMDLWRIVGSQTEGARLLSGSTFYASDKPELVDAGMK